MEESSTGELRKVIAELRVQVAALARRVEELTAENRRLSTENARLSTENKWLWEQLDEAKKEAARQAAPFRRPERKKIPKEKQKKPGRRPGHAGLNRPIPDHVDEVIVVPLDACPNCGGRTYSRRGHPITYRCSYCQYVHDTGATGG